MKYRIVESKMDKRLKDTDRIFYAKRAHIIGFNIANAFNVPFESKYLSKSELNGENQWGSYS